MRRKVRSSARVLRWKASGLPSGVAAAPSPGASDLVQQELPLKESTAGLRVITVILAVMLLHVLFIGGIALYNLLGGGGKSARGGSAGPKSPAVLDESRERPVQKPREEVSATVAPPSSPSVRSRRGGGKGQGEASPLSNAEETGRKKGGKRRLRRVSAEEDGEEANPSKMAPANRQRTEEARDAAQTSLPARLQDPSAEPSASAAGGSGVYHVVRGDTLWRIARRFHVGLDDLMTLNRLTLASKLHIGQELRIPAAKASRARRSGEAAGG
ncbi:LysM domain-containing protein [Methylacidimicrobium sp. B4]|uniref:LysM peptidoglycan-binding domain-containing protein n=1 Tax=Methylacidimicrobium sp. B4 TaxID=2796139 RepID=UPI001A90A770|nr:LysM domain-containing protein [Methylacidimicrobium sp. B4]QSR84494.1 LysM peptidoglycan-binding domain-containing protein [Methylacidimicrobium sp. B4]